MAPPGEVESASFNGTPALRPKPKGDSARIKVLDTRSRMNVLRIEGILIGWIVIFGEAFQQNRRAGAAAWPGRRAACPRQSNLRAQLCSRAACVASSSQRLLSS